jgi:hypothetical protein
MKKDMKKFLKRMIKDQGFIADGVYSDGPRFWIDNNRVSSRLMDIVLFTELRRNGYIKQDRTGRYLVTKKGVKFVTPWYKKIFDVI